MFRVDYQRHATEKFHSNPGINGIEDYAWDVSNIFIPGTDSETLMRHMHQERYSSLHLKLLQKPHEAYAAQHHTGIVLHQI